MRIDLHRKNLQELLNGVEAGRLHIEDYEDLLLKLKKAAEKNMARNCAGNDEEQER